MNSINKSSLIYRLPATHWELKAGDALIDVYLKKITLIAIAIINLVALGVAFYYMTININVPAFLASPFFVGALAALASLKVPTFGLSSYNYRSLLNPAYVIGSVVSYLFFGPFVYAMNRLDLTHYYDPNKANKITKHLSEDSFEALAKKYEYRWDNLVKYGFIHESFKEELKNIYNDYQPIRDELDYWKQEGLSNCEEAQSAQDKLANIEKRWKDLKEKIQAAYPFPTPKKKTYDFSKRSTKLSLFFRNFLSFKKNPIASTWQTHTGSRSAGT